MEIKAKLLQLFDTQSVTNTFKKREFVVEYADNPQYPEFIKFELIQDKCDLIDQFEVGQMITIHFNLKGRKWTDPKGMVKYFNTLQAWRIESGGTAEASLQEEEDHTNQSEPEWLTNDDADQEKLPF